MQNLRPFIFSWVFFTSWLIYEYTVMSLHLPLQHFLPTIVCLFQSGPCSQEVMTNLESGEPISYFLGWVGFILIVLTNGYIAKKRLQSGNQGANLKAWLNWHIFFGLMGPTCIFFHTGGHIGGLAAIGFWAMMCSFVSGIIGRFLYIRMLQAEQEIKQGIRQVETRIARLVEESQGALKQEHLKYIYRQVFQVALGHQPKELVSLSSPQLLMWGVAGECKLAFWSPALRYDDPLMKHFFCKWGLLHIRLRCLPTYRKVFANWHSFHAPFAILMYVTVLVHIASSFIFQAHG